MQELKELVESADEDTEIMYEDEAVVTHEPTTTGKWAPMGEQPIIPTDSRGSVLGE